MRVGSETNGAKNGIYFVIPMAGAPTEAIQSFKKKPVFVLGCIWVPRGGSDNSRFRSRKNALAEGVFAIALFEGPTMLSGHTNQETETVETKNGRKAVAFRPDAVFPIAQHNDTRFGAKGHQLFVLFDSEDTHSRDGLRSTLLTKCPVFAQSYLLEGTHFFNTTLLLIITLEPDLTIGVSRGQRL